MMALIPLFMLFPLFYNRGGLTLEFQPGFRPTRQKMGVLSTW